METTAKKKGISTKEMALAGVMAAITCAVAPFSLPIPISPVPITLITLLLYFSVYILGTKKAFISYAVYLAVGFAGIPVFSGFTGGVGKLAGPTGGYLIGFVFMIPLTGIIFEKAQKKIWLQVVGMITGTLVDYLFGTVWLCLQLNLDFAGGLFIGVIPYLPGDAVKIMIAAIAGPVIARAVKRAV